MPNAKVLSEKQAIVAQLTEKIQKATAGVIVDYKGITVEEDTALRKECRESNVDYAVVKNTLLRFAFNNTGLGDLDDLLNGTTSLALCDDPVAPARVMANYAKSKGYTKVAILYGNDDDYSIGLADSFEEQCKKNGMEVTAKESGSFSDMDFSAQLTKIASTNPEVVFLPFYGEQASMILSRAASIGMDVTFLGGDGISNIVDFMTDKKLLTKVVYCDHFDANSETEIVKKFKADFKAKYGTDVTLSFSATAYDAALVICQAILRAGSTDKATIVEQIKAGTFDGVTSTITFDDHNDPIKSAFIMTFDESGNKTFIELLGNE